MLRGIRSGLIPLSVVTGLVLVSSCSSSTASAPAASKPTAPVDSTSGYAAPKCTRPAAKVPESKADGEGTAQVDVTSFDGTIIRAHWFPNPQATATTKFPTVLKGPGWSQPGDVNTESRGDGIFGDLNIANLWDAGYNVLTWDPRGFGESGGVVSTNDPKHEGRDTQVLVDWVARQPGVELDRPGDPRMGMVGGSYGGDIQFVLAALDCRVDAIVPTIAWHSLGTSLYKADTVKQGWADQLYGFAADRELDPHITSAHESGDATGTISAADRAWFLSRGPGKLIEKVHIPTLIVQGTVDTLFTLDEAVTNYGILARAGVPVSMIWFCGGHGVCLTKAGDPAVAGDAAVAWLARYVQRDESGPVGAGFSTVDQNGDRFEAEKFPAASGSPVRANGLGTLNLVETTVEKAAPVDGAPSAVLGGVAGSITPARATNGVDVDIPFADSTMVLGAPRLSLTYSGTVAAGPRPERVFAQIVDPATGLVLGNQITPIKVTLDGSTRTVSVPLEMVVFSATPGAKLTLQLVATTTAYAQPRLGGSVTFSKINVALPTVTGMQAR